MTEKEKIQRKLKKYGLTAVNKAKKTPNHPRSSHIVLAKKGSETKLIRFGQQGVTGAGKNPQTKEGKARRNLTMLDIMHRIQILVYFLLYTGLIRSNGKF